MAPQGHDVAVSSVPTRLPRPRSDGVRVLVAMLAVMWAVEVVDALDGHGLDAEGIMPRDASGLLGIVFAPFLHASFGHLIANTVPFVALGLVIALEGARRLLTVTALVALVSGLGTWLTAAAASVTLGASGVVFGYATYLAARGVFSRRLGQLAVGVLVGVMFGGALLWGLVPRSGISWQDHLFGAIGGVGCARLLTERRAPRARFSRS